MMMLPATYPTWIEDGSPIPDPFRDGEKAVNFIRNLKHPKSKARGQAFQLDPWAERIIRRIYGPRHEADVVEDGIVVAKTGDRIVKTVFAMIPRGNRKTSVLGAPIALLHTIGPEKTPGGQVVCAAADQKQARIALTEALGVLNADRRLAGTFRDLVYTNKIVGTKTSTVLEAISADAKTQHGRTPSLCICDELHAWPKRDLWEALKTGLIKTAGSLNVIITTAGRGQENIAFEQYDYARRVALGEIDDPATLPILFEASPDCDWQDEAVWRQVNPGLACGYPDLAGLRQLAKEASQRPSDREAFRQLNLNIWLDSSAAPFLDAAAYNACAMPIDPEKIASAPCWIGVDMSTTTDLTAVVAAYRIEDAGDPEPLYAIVPKFFCPADELRLRSDRDRVPYVRWRDEGHLEATPGNVVDHGAVAAYIRDLASRHDVREIAFDPAYAQAVMAPLLADGLPVATMRQGWVTQSPALNTLERAVISGRLHHGGHPLLRWCFENVAIQTDAAGNRTMHKGISRGRIDGAVATWMAVARAAAGDAACSIYATAARPDGLLMLDLNF